MNLRRHLAEVTNQYAELFGHRGSIRLALWANNIALALHGSQSSVSLPSLLGTRGNLYLMQREPAAAMDVFLRAGGLTKLERDTSLRVQLLNGQAAAESALNRHDAAIVHLTDAAAEARAAGIPDEVLADVLTNLALALADKGTHDEAYRRMSEALSIRQRHQDTPHLVNAASNMGLVYMRAGRFEEAREQYAEALTIAKRSHLADIAALSPLLGLATAESALGNFERGKVLAEEAVELARRNFGRGEPRFRDAQERLDLIRRASGQ